MDFRTDLCARATAHRPVCSGARGLH
jgi:hypothetical protein